MLFCIYSSFCSVIIHKVFYRVYLVSPQLDHKLLGSWTVLIFFFNDMGREKNMLSSVVAKRTASQWVFIFYYLSSALNLEHDSF